MEQSQKRITSVLQFINGMVAVFDENDQQWPEFQGPFEEMQGKIAEQIGRQGTVPEILLRQKWGK